MQISKPGWLARRQRRQPGDAIRSLGGKVFESRSNAQLEEAVALVKQVLDGQIGNPASSAKDSGKRYMEFVRQRKQSLAAGLLTDMAMLELYDKLERDVTLRKLVGQYGAAVVTDEVESMNTKDKATRSMVQTNEAEAVNNGST